ncbi:MAG: lipopolysaccharide heptosyltransferase I [Rhodocyclaceae bacterium]|nr:lipopolysaccharide heptosyltransferase I [Rhodocyclaceae bacterium]
MYCKTGRYNRRAIRILLVKATSLGDVIHNLPVASDIRRVFPQAEIDWVVEEGFAELPRLHPAVRRVLPVAVRRWRKALLARATWREIGTYRRLASADFYDAVLDTQGLLKSALLSTPARFYDHCFAIPRNQHAVMRNRQLAAAALGYALDDLPLDYGIAAPPLVAPWLPADHYAVLLTATSRADKEWPEAHWLALAAALNAAGLRCILPGGSASERSRAVRLAQGMASAIAAPAMNLTELAGLLAGARVVIGVDTGLVHLAAALQRPTVALYSASDPILTGVLAGEHCVNLGGIGTPAAPAEVAATALKLL